MVASSACPDACRDGGEQVGVAVNGIGIDSAVTAKTTVAIMPPTIEPTAMKASPCSVKKTVLTKPSSVGGW